MVASISHCSLKLSTQFGTNGAQPPESDEVVVDDPGEAESEAGEDEEKSNTSKEHIKFGVKVPECNSTTNEI